VRSSATAEDLPDASFAGQQETFLNIRGLDNVMAALRNVFASLYNDRAISYRCHRGFAHSSVAPLRGRATHGAQRSGCERRDVHPRYRIRLPRRRVHHRVLGLGELVVQGAVNPDEFYVHKPMLRSGKFPVIRRGLGSKLQEDGICRAGSSGPFGKDRGCARGRAQTASA